MKINYDFPWYLQNSEGFMALYTGLYDVATNISPISLLSALDIDNTTTPEQLKLIATLYGLRGDFVAIQDALIYDIKKWSKKDNSLPEGYTEVEYIEMDGTEYVDTGVMLASTDVVETYFKCTNTTTAMALYGIYKTNENTSFYANGTFYAYNKTNQKINTDVDVDEEWHLLNHNFVQGTVQLDDITRTFTPYTFANTTSCRLGIRLSGSSWGYGFVGQIGSFKIYRNGALLLNYIPAKHGDDVGFYDTVNQEFLTSEVGDFVAGPEGPSGVGEVNYWSGRMTETTDLLVNYIKAKVQIRNKNLTLQTLKQFFEVCLAHRDFNPSTDISVEESTLHFDLTVSVDGDILNDMVTLLSVDPYPFGKPTGISYSINYVQE